MRRALLVLATLIAVAVLIPLSVLATVAMGLPARHWSGAHLNDVRWNGDGYAGGNQPASLFDDPSVLERQEKITDEVMTHGAPQPRVVMIGTDVNCVNVVTVRLDNELFNQLGPYGDATCVIYSPREGIAYQQGGGGGSEAEPPTTYWDAATLPEAYWVLLSGFPLHIAAMLLLAGLAWTVPRLMRRRRSHRRPVGDPDTAHT